MGSNAETNSRNREMVFDAEWTLPLNVMNKLDEIGLVNRDISCINYGQFFVTKGGIQLSDLSTMKGLWPFFGKILNKQTGGNKSAKNKSAELTSKDFLEILSILPHTLQFSMLTANGNRLWSTLEPKHLVVNHMDFSLKHVSTIAGEWHVLGLLDAKPTDGIEENEIVNQTPQSVQDMQNLLMSTVKPLLGRQKGDYGVTPILIFRVCR